SRYKTRRHVVCHQQECVVRPTIHKSSSMLSFEAISCSRRASARMLQSDHTISGFFHLATRLKQSRIVRLHTAERQREHIRKIARSERRIAAEFLSNSEELKKGNANASISTVLVSFVTCVLLRRFRCCAGTEIESFKSFADCYQDKGSGARDRLLSRHDWFESPPQQQSHFGFGLRRYDFAIGRK